MDQTSNPVDHQRQLLEEQARLEASINSLNVGFIMISRQFEVTVINSEAKRIFNLTPDPSTTLMHQLDRKLITVLNLHQVLEKVMADHLIEVKEVGYDTKFYRLFINPIVVQPTKEVIGAVLLIEDITEAKVLERSKDEFFAIASHELRTPLTAIRGFAYLIRRYFASQIDNPRFATMLDRIDQSSIRLIEIVNEFLDTSRLEQNRLVFKKETVDIGNLIRELADEYQPTATAKNLQIMVDIPAGPPLLAETDPNRVKQILVNLLSNALKYTTIGHITISAGAEANFIKILVTDTGSGISEANQAMLFRKFQQANNSPYARDATGAGLGLYISKLLVLQMGGTIALERSAPNQGSVFSFTLPKPSSANIKQV